MVSVSGSLADPINLASLVGATDVECIAYCHMGLEQVSWREYFSYLYDTGTSHPLWH